MVSEEKRLGVRWGGGSLRSQPRAGKMLSSHYVACGSNRSLCTFATHSEACGNNRSLCTFAAHSEACGNNRSIHMLMNTAILVAPA
jgi:hypothetical protein